MSAEQQLTRGIAQLQLALGPPEVDKLLRYLALLAKWNQVYNLTAVRDESRMVSHHLLDSLAVLPHVAAKRLLDVGSGGGLPGVPLAIALPRTHVALLDSNQKKAAFLRQVAIELGLGNVEVVAGRAEAHAPSAPYDVIISRAFADLAEFVAAARHLLAPGGRFVAMKGVLPHEEIGHLPAAWRVAEVIPLRVPGVDAHRHLVIVSASPAAAR